MVTVEQLLKAIDHLYDANRKMDSVLREIEQGEIRGMDISNKWSQAG